MTLGELTNLLLFEKHNYGGIFNGLQMLHNFYAGITGITAEHTTDDNVLLPTGKAISPGQAANCLLDLQRTSVFIRGIHKAILRLQQEVNGPINILYAGCGPYATLLTPLTAVFKPEEVRFHLMDVNEQSVSSVERLYANLKADVYIDELICQDATTYQFTKPMHLVIAEAMQSGLAKEPQVAIMKHLIPQMDEKAIFIPQEINISAKLVDREKEMEARFNLNNQAERIELGKIYSIGKENYCDQEPAIVRIPEEIGTFNELYLFTDLTVFEDEHLTDNESGVTIPCRLGNIEAARGMQVKFEYVISETPGFRWELLKEVEVDGDNPELLDLKAKG